MVLVFLIHRQINYITLPYQIHLQIYCFKFEIIYDMQVGVNIIQADDGGVFYKFSMFIYYMGKG